MCLVAVSAESPTPLERPTLVDPICQSTTRAVIRTTRHIYYNLNCRPREDFSLNRPRAQKRSQSRMEDGKIFPWAVYCYKLIPATHLRVIQSSAVVGTRRRNHQWTLVEINTHYNRLFLLSASCVCGESVY